MTSDAVIELFLFTLIEAHRHLACARLARRTVFGYADVRTACELLEWNVPAAEACCLSAGQVRGMSPSHFAIALLQFARHAPA